jgi:hypothetical protein
MAGDLLDDRVRGSGDPTRGRPIETRRGRGGPTFLKRAPSMPSAKEIKERSARGPPAYLQDPTNYREAITAEAAALAAREGLGGVP